MSVEGVTEFLDEAKTITDKVDEVLGSIEKVIGHLQPIFMGIAALVTVLGGPGFKGLTAIVGSLSCLSGIFSKDVRLEELGARALQHPEIKRDDFESDDAYKNELLNASFDREKFEEGLKNEKSELKYLITGFELANQLMQEKYKMEIGMNFWQTIKEKDLSAEDCKVILDSLSSNRVQTNVFVGYINDSEGVEKTVEMANALDEMKKFGVNL